MGGVEFGAGGCRLWGATCFCLRSSSRGLLWAPAAYCGVPRGVDRAGLHQAKPTEGLRPRRCRQRRDEFTVATTVRRIWSDHARLVLVFAGWCGLPVADRGALPQSVRLRPEH